MDEIIASTNVDEDKSLHIASLARQTVIDAGADHLGFDGFFIFEVDEKNPQAGMSILAKAASMEAAFRIADLWAKRSA